MQRFLIRLSILSIALTAIAPIAQAADLNPTTQLSDRFEQSRDENLDKLNDRFEQSRDENLDKLNDRFEQARWENLDK